MKRILFFAFISLISIFIAACGGGGSSSSAQDSSGKVTSPTQPQSCASIVALGTQNTPKCHVTIYVAGDSTNWGVDIDNSSNQVQAPGVGNGIAGRASPTPTQMLQAWADQTYGPGVVGFIDGSIPGATLPSDLNGTPPSISPLATRLASLPVHADVVLTNSQINDQYVLGMTNTQYQDYLKQWIGVVVQYGAVPVYQEPNPIALGSGSYPNYNAQIQATNEMVYGADVTFQTAGFPALGNTYEWENYTSPPNASPWNVLWLSSDLVHPNQAGYAVKASNYWNGVATANGVNYGGLNAVVQKVLAGLTQ